MKFREKGDGEIQREYCTKYKLKKKAIITINYIFGYIIQYAACVCALCRYMQIHLPSSWGVVSNEICLSMACGWSGSSIEVCVNFSQPRIFLFINKCILLYS